jgi:hypothetical protein
MPPARACVKPVKQIRTARLFPEPATYAMRRAVRATQGARRCRREARRAGKAGVASAGTGLLEMLKGNSDGRLFCIAAQCSTLLVRRSRRGSAHSAVRSASHATPAPDRGWTVGCRKPHIPRHTPRTESGGPRRHGCRGTTGMGGRSPSKPTGRARDKERDGRRPQCRDLIRVGACRGASAVVVTPSVRSGSVQPGRRRRNRDRFAPPAQACPPRRDASSCFAATWRFG